MLRLIRHSIKSTRHIRHLPFKRLIRPSLTELCILPHRRYSNTNQTNNKQTSKSTKTAAMDGAEACSNAAYALSESAFISNYPIH